MRTAAVARRTVAVLGVMMLATLAMALPSDAKEPSAVSRYASCVAGSGEGDLLILLDESGSLKDSDPDDNRVAAGRYLLRQVADFADRTGADVEVSLAGFGTSFRGYGNDWTKLDSSSLESVDASLRAFKDRNTDYGTDYWLGLDGARKELAARADKSPDRCQAIVFFSDGALDVQRAANEDDFHFTPRPYDEDNPLRTTADQDHATQSAAKSLCRPGGLADQLRSAGIVMLGVGFTATAQESDFTLMRGIVTGKGPQGGCGDIVSPVPGSFYMADGIDNLLKAFSSLTRNAPDTTAPICQGKPCKDGAHPFVLDQSVGSVDILAQSNVDGLTVVLTAPDGSTIDLKRTEDGVVTSLGLDSVQGSVEWLSDRSLSIQMDREGSSQWRGAWALTFVDPTSSSAENDKQSTTNIEVTGDLVPSYEADDKNPLRTGGEAKLLPSVVNASGEAVAGDELLGTATLDVSLVNGMGADVISVEETKDDIGSPVVLDLADVEAGDYTLRMLLNVTTASAKTADGRTVAGTDLTPQAVDIPVQILPPLGYPTVPSTVSFGRIEGAVRATAAVPVTGPGCVWLDPTGTQLTASPDGVVDVTLVSAASSAETCLQVAAGTTVDLPLELASPQQGNGSLTGSANVVMLPLEEPRTTRTQPLTFSADIAKPVDAGKLWVTLVAALILGPGIPLALMYLFKFLLASKIPGRPFVATVAEITVDRGRVLRDGEPLALRGTDNKDFYSVAKGGSRRVALTGGIVLRARLGWSPVGSGYVLVEAPGYLGASDVHPDPVGRGRQAKLPLAVQDHWVLLASPGVADRARVLLISAGSSSAAEQRALTDAAAQRIPGLLESLSALHPGTSGGPPDDPGDGHDTDPPDVTRSDAGFDPLANEENS